MPGFVLHCQPIVDLATDQIAQYELLPRVDGDHSEIDRWVAHRAIHLIAEHDVRLEVHVSARSMSDPAVPELVERELDLTGIDPSRLVLTIAEQDATADLERAGVFAERLARLGCRFAVDDFGAGSSFYALKHLPLEYLKIDGDFIRGLTGSVADQLVAESMVDTARGMGMTTIASFVEAEETVTLLRETGVDYSQGAFHGVPRPVAVELARPAPAL